jgi:hypothetical protein
MFSKITLTICVLIVGILVPILEVNETHLFNPLWPPHARLHEAWQLTSNTATALVCLWLAWSQSRVRLASFLALVVTAGFLVAFAARQAYGGSMQHTDGTEIVLLGVNAAVLVMGIASLVLAIMCLVRSPQSPSANASVV